jgi:hypothetical protein
MRVQHLKQIERLIKAFKGHRCALDFDRGFVNSELKEAIGKKDDNTWINFYDRTRSESDCRKISRHSTPEICIGS